MRCQFENDQASATNGSFTRRQWLGRVPPSALAALLAGGFTGEPGFASAQVKSDPGADDFGAHVYNVRQYGAKGDGTTLDTAAVQAAIDACNRNGGGIVLIPAGTFQIGTVELKSHVTLHIAAAGKLLGSADGNWPLLFAVNATNVTIEGAGTIDGQGAQFHSAVRGTPPPSGLGGNRRPYHLLFHRCDRLTVRDIALVDSARLVGSFLRRHFGVYW